MKRIALVLGLTLLLFTVGCGDDLIEILAPDDLAPPLGLVSITGDEEITVVWWCSNFDSDLLGYKVYLAEGVTADSPPEEIPAAFAPIDSMEVSAPSAGQLSLTVGGLTNGTTYSFLVVAASDEWNEVSQPSNIITDTPRPETAASSTLTARQVDSSTSGMEMSDFSVVDCNDLDGSYNTTTGGDIMCERFDPGAGMRLWLDGINGAELQDLGFMSDLDGADVAPADGYNPTGHSVEALLGHVYAVKTADNRYAKVQVVSLDVNVGTVTVNAAYQAQDGNPDYK